MRVEAALVLYRKCENGLWMCGTRVQESGEVGMVAQVFSKGESRVVL